MIHLLRSLLSIIAFVFPTLSNAQGGWTWAKSIGNKGYDHVREIVAAPSGNIYLTGYCSDTTDFNPDPINTYLLDSYFGDFLYALKLDGNGNFLWAFAIADTQSIKGEAVTLDNYENIILAGTFYQSVDFDPDTNGTYTLNSYNQEALFICKYDSSGDFIWARAFKGPGQKDINAVATDSDGNVYAIGSVYDTLDFNPDPFIEYNLVPPGNYTTFIFKLDSTGNFLWAHLLDADFSYGWDITIDNNDDVVILGEASSTIDLNPDSIVSDTLVPYFFGDTYFAKYNSSGQYLWGRMFVSWDVDGAYDIITDVDDNILLSGDFAGILEMIPGNDTLLIGESAVHFGGYITKFTQAGNPIWAKQLPSQSNFVPYGIQTDLQGRVYTTGYFKDSADFNPDTLVSNWLISGFFGDVYLSVLDSSGNYISAISAGGTYSEYPEKLTIDNLGNVYVTGQFDSEIIYFGNDSLVNIDTSPSTTYDIFIAKAGNFTSGINDHVNETNDEISIYPNPASHFFRLKMHGVTSKVSVSISGIAGNFIRGMVVTENHPVPISDLSAGIYMVQITSGGFIETKKLIVTED